jgi:hypothetical protein
VCVIIFNCSWKYDKMNDLNSDVIFVSWICCILNHTQFNHNMCSPCNIALHYFFSYPCTDVTIVCKSLTGALIYVNTTLFTLLYSYMFQPSKGHPQDIVIHFVSRVNEMHVVIPADGPLRAKTCRRVSVWIKWY